MSMSFFRSKKFEERRHAIGAMILLSLLFVGHYMPVTLTLFLMVFVTWMAIISFGKIHRGLIVSTVSFLIPFVILAMRDWKATGSEEIGIWDSIELSLEVSVLLSMIICAVMWVKKILRSKRAGFDEVVGACNLYIWIATIYACLYTVISKINPQAFFLHEVLSKGMEPAELKQNFDNLYYFSFVTQTTLGYGDIVPVSHFARSLAVSQAIIGQFYVAVVLTYILNLWIRDLGKQVKKDSPS
jgi:uncharacterized membrane protein (DUF485 family)